MKENEYECNTVEELNDAMSESRGSGVVITCSEDVFAYAEKNGYCKEVKILDATT